MDQQQIGRLVRLDRAFERAALPALLGVGRGVLIGDLGNAEALDGDAEPGAVHHHEHRRKAPVLFADQPALRAVEIEHGGRVAVNAHLVLDRAAHDAVALADAAIGARQKFRHEEERDALHPCRRALDSRQHQVDDVIGKVVLAGGDENLLAGDGVGAVGLRDRAGLDEAEIGAAMGLGQAHRACPLAGGHLRQIAGLELVAAVDGQRRDRAVGEAGIH